MALNAVNLMEAAGFGKLCKCRGFEYKIVMHLGGDVALAVPNNRSIPCPVELITIDPVPTEEPETSEQGGGNGDAGKDAEQ